MFPNFASPMTMSELIFKHNLVSGITIFDCTFQFPIIVFVSQLGVGPGIPRDSFYLGMHFREFSFNY